VGDFPHKIQVARRGILIEILQERKLVEELILAKKNKKGGGKGIGTRWKKGGEGRIVNKRRAVQAVRQKVKNA
jgi:hypothetical protein